MNLITYGIIAMAILGLVVFLLIFSDTLYQKKRIRILNYRLKKPRD